MRFRLSDQGSVFSTRSRGSALREELLADLGETEVLELDVSDVRGLSYSFADEFVGALLQRLTSDRVRLIDVPVKFRRVIEYSAEQRGIDIEPRDLFDLAPA